MRIPSAIGKVDFCDAMSIWCSTTDCARATADRRRLGWAADRRRLGGGGGWAVAGLGGGAYLEIALRLGGALKVGDCVVTATQDGHGAVCMCMHVGETSRVCVRACARLLVWKEECKKR